MTPTLASLSATGLPTVWVPAIWVVVGRVAVAAVWVYEGLVAKLLRTRPDEAAILEAVPVIGGPALGVAIGVWELVLAAAVLAGRPSFLPRLPVLVAAAQTLTLAVFNLGGLVFAGEQIADAAHLLITNAALLVLVWGIALARPGERP